MILAFSAVGAAMSCSSLSYKQGGGNHGGEEIASTHRSAIAVTRRIEF